MLDLQRIEIAAIAEALDDRSDHHSWWLDPETGEVILWSDYEAEQGEEHPELRDLRLIDPLSSREGYKEMQEFVGRLTDPRARTSLEQAIGGRGAFRRFKDTLLEFPELRELWFRFHDVRLERHAIHWLVAEGLVDEPEGERALGDRPEPELP